MTRASLIVAAALVLLETVFYGQGIVTVGSPGTELEFAL